jgi:hypothetical protein
MRILFDQGTPVPLRSALVPHHVATAFERGWQILMNGDLLSRAAQRHQRGDHRGEARPAPNSAPQQEIANVEPLSDALRLLRRQPELEDACAGPAESAWSRSVRSTPYGSS